MPILSRKNKKQLESIRDLDFLAEQCAYKSLKNDFIHFCLDALWTRNSIMDLNQIQFKKGVLHSEICLCCYMSIWCRNAQKTLKMRLIFAPTTCFRAYARIQLAGFLSPIFINDQFTMKIQKVAERQTSQTYLLPHSMEIIGFFCHSDFTWNQV